MVKVGIGANAEERGQSRDQIYITAWILRKGGMERRDDDGGLDFIVSSLGGREQTGREDERKNGD